jgi:hypothetical protein
MKAKDEQRLKHTRCASPCKDCAERFTACSDRCPKDNRGEYGYKAWKEDNARVEQTRKEYYTNMYEDSKRSKKRWDIKR